LSYLPVFSSVITTRLVLISIPAIAVLLALWLERVYQGLSDGIRRGALSTRLVAVGLVALALVPLTPKRLPIVSPEPVPVFFSSGEWRSYVPAGRVVVTVPLTSLSNAMEGMRWTTNQHLDVVIAGGYFLGPDEHGVTMFGPPLRPTASLLATVNKKGHLSPVTATNQADAVADLRYWKAAIVVLDAQKKYAPQLKQTTTELLGFAPRLVDGVWLWDVRSIV
jgi:hypothetical protein